MNNIFEGAKFGDKFLTRSGEISLLIHIQNDYIYTCRIDNVPPIDIEYYPDGKRKDNGFYMLDIVSRYEEPIDEKEVLHFCNEYLAYEHIFSLETLEKVKKAFVAGYRKAKGE